MRPGRTEAIELIIAGVAGIAFLLGFSPYVSSWIVPIGGLFALAALAGAVGFLIIVYRSGGNPLIAIIQLWLIVIFVFLMMYLPMWYFISYLPSTGQPIMEFKLVEITPRPTIMPEGTHTPRPTPTPRSTNTILPTHTLAPTATRRP
jgi:hypothetical protein